MTGVPELDAETFLNWYLTVFLTLFVATGILVIRAVCEYPYIRDVRAAYDYPYRQDVTLEGGLGRLGDGPAPDAPVADIATVEDGDTSLFLSDAAERRRSSVLLVRSGFKKKLRRRASNLV
uniref:Uncharacterized protein n=1 Tax=Branchiostoma floridae TaxID=7739 RepID=C3ZZ83_BRAFL|eukprot:XP_002586132.1 hypothetical protein BRAFLDRAFT_105919 [Branchiostoma floridae]